MNLPSDNYLPVQKLAACFNTTSATYKYYWLLSVVQEVEMGHHQIYKRNLFARMISNAWYTVNYFHVSFGKQDLIQNVVRFIKDVEGIPIDEKQNSVYQSMIISENKETERQLWHFNKNVPHWFLSPWFPKSTNENYTARRNRIYKLSATFTNDCLYALHKDYILINPKWIDYLQNNAKILKDFCYWNLTLYLQTKNPNVPGIPDKIFKNELRKNLDKQKKNFWNLVIRENGPVTCIYTGKQLAIDQYALEHYIPHNFISHDLIWNLIPADPVFNSKKNDKLPGEDYFDSFFNLQNLAVKFIRETHPKNTFLEDYLTIFPDYFDSFTKERFRETIQPLITIAHNNGFEFM